MLYDWLPSGQAVSPAVLQERDNATQDVPPSCGADMQDTDASAGSHSHNVSMMKVGSGQGKSANEGTASIKATPANEEGTAASDFASANERPPEDETPAKSCEAEAKQAASPQTDAHQTDKGKASAEANEVSRQIAVESASQVPTDSVEAADKALESVGTETTPTATGTFAPPQQSPLGVASAMGSAYNPRQRIADSNDPKDPYSISFKVQPWPFKTMGL